MLEDLRHGALINHRLIEAYPPGFTGATVMCEDTDCGLIETEFRTAFADEWARAIDAAEAKYRMPCCEKGMPLPVSAWVEHGFCDSLNVTAEPLGLTLGDGAIIDNELGTAAFENALKSLTQAHESLSFEAAVAYSWNIPDRSGTVNYCFTSEDVRDKHGRVYVGFIDDRPIYKGGLKFMIKRFRHAVDDGVYGEGLRESVMRIFDEPQDKRLIADIFDDLHHYAPRRFLDAFYDRFAEAGVFGGDGEGELGFADFDDSFADLDDLYEDSDDAFAAEDINRYMGDFPDPFIIPDDGTETEGQ